VEVNFPIFKSDKIKQHFAKSFSENKILKTLTFFLFLDPQDRKFNLLLKSKALNLS